MFDEVLECAGRMEEEEEEERGGDAEDSDIGVCPGDKDNKMDTEKSEEEAGSKEEERGASEKPRGDGDELGSPPSGALSPPSRSVEAGVTPMVRGHYSIRPLGELSEIFIVPCSTASDWRRAGSPTPPPCS